VATGKGSVFDIAAHTAVVHKQISKYGDIQNTSLTPDKELKMLTY